MVIVAEYTQGKIAIRDVDLIQKMELHVKDSKLKK